MTPRRHITTFALLICFASTPCVFAQATAEADKSDEKKKPIKMVDTTLAGGRLKLQVAASWKKPAKRRSRIIEREFTVPAAKGDKASGRLTMMQSGGSLKQNVERWFGQFKQPDGRATKDVAKVSEKKINGQDVTIVDITGTFKESMGGGPFAPGKTVMREDYRMLGGIVQTKVARQYFFKLYGPKKTITEAEPAFLKMMDSVAPAK